MQRYNKVNVGENVLEMFQLDLQLEKDAIAALNAGIALCRAKGDNGFRAARGRPRGRGGARRLARDTGQLAAIDQIGAELPHRAAEEIAPVGAVGRYRPITGRRRADRYVFQDVRKKWPRVGWRAFVGVLALLATLSALDPDGIRRYLRLRGDARRMEDDNARLAAESGRPAREVRAPAPIPRRRSSAAREELRFVRPGERVFWVGERREAGP